MAPDVTAIAPQLLALTSWLVARFLSLSSCAVNRNVGDVMLFRCMLCLYVALCIVENKMAKIKQPDSIQ